MADATDENGRKHRYHAEAIALHGMLDVPLRHVIEPQATSGLHPEGGYQAQKTNEFRAESAITYRAAHTQVSGIRDKKPGHGWATLSTSVVEGLNIFEVVTADRIVAQISTEHPLVGHTPAISFLGTRFENLRIAGNLIDPHLDIDFCGKQPADDVAYTRHPEFMGRVSSQCSQVCSYEGLPEAARKRYNRGPVITEKTETAECSLVHGVSGKFPGKSFGHVLHVPNFGTIYLATVTLLHEPAHGDEPPQTTVELTMVHAEMGCLASGSAKAGVSKTNGMTKP